MSAAGRAIVIALLQETRPQIAAGLPFVHAAGDNLELDSATEPRRFDMQGGIGRPTGLASGVPTQWAARWTLRIDYPAPIGCDLEALFRMIESDVRCIVRKLAVAGSWAGVLDELAPGVPLSPEFINNRAGVRTKVRISLPLDVTYQEAP